MRITSCTLTALMVLSGCFSSEKEVNHPGEQTNDRPNLILIVADDLGYGDLGSFGSEINTPNLDNLAAEGTRLTSFHVQAACSPSRSMLLTGIDNHLNGMGTMADFRLPHHENQPGYVGYLNQDVVTVARLLQDAGYHTYMSGKWHLGYENHQSPYARGFEDTFALINGGANHFNGQTISGDQNASYRRNGEEVERPEGYSSDLFTDELLKLIAAKSEDGQPFFAYLSFTAPHFPLQAPQHTIEKYSDHYAPGWDAIRAQRFQRLKNMGWVSAGLELPDRLAEVPPWSQLSEKEQHNEARRMAIYASMIDNLDANVGRLIQYLKESGEYDSSVIIFMSDNGPSAIDRAQSPEYQTAFSDNSYQNMGAGNSHIYSNPAWAQVSSVFHRYYKVLPTEGGMRVPFILRLPNESEGGQVLDAFASVLDITPTLLDMAGVEHPGAQYEGRKIYPMGGHSILPYVEGRADSVYTAEEIVPFELFGHASVFMGPWKALRLQGPWGDNSWSLFNIDSDPGEQVDLSQQEPEQLNILISAYARYAIDYGVITEHANATVFSEKPTYLELEN